MHEASTITFVEQPNFYLLDKCDDKWYHLLDIQINIQNIILTCVR